MSLHPTKTRRTLLQAVADGQVIHHPCESPHHGSWWMGTKVTERMAELERAGWVRRGEAIYDEWPSPSQWELTTAGRAILVDGQGHVAAVAS